LRRSAAGGWNDCATQVASKKTDANLGHHASPLFLNFGR
jgi:hypothetical protein